MARAALLAVPLLLLLLMVLNPTAEAARKKKTPRKSPQLVSKFCEGKQCGIYLEFYPPTDQNGSFDCFWTRVKVDLPKYSTWTMNKDSVQIFAPGNQSCLANDVYLSSNDILSLEAPTLDCYRSVGCLCSSISPKANQEIGWARATTLLQRGYSHTVCREASTYLYVRLNCTLSNNDLTDDEKIDAGYIYYEDDGSLSAPATIAILWNRTYDYSDAYALTANTTGNRTRKWCKAGAKEGMSGLNRWFLTILLFIALAVLALVLLYIMVCALWAMACGRRGDNDAVPLATGQANFLVEVLSVEHYNGRDRWLTAFLVAGVGLYIAGIIFEPSIRAQNAYERAISPSLQAALLSVVNIIDAGDFTSFLRRVVRLALIIALSSAWGAFLFLALLYNLSAAPASRASSRARVVHVTKLVVSVGALLFLDWGLVAYTWASYESRSRWRSPAAYYFLLNATALLYAIPHIQLVCLVFSRKPVPAVRAQTVGSCTSSAPPCDVWSSHTQRIAIESSSS